MRGFSFLVLFLLGYMFSGSCGVYAIAITDFYASSTPNLNATIQLRCTVQGSSWNTNINITVTGGGGTGDATLVDLMNESVNQTTIGVFEVTPTQRLTQFRCAVKDGQAVIERNLTLRSYAQPSLRKPAVVSDVHSTGVFVSWDQWNADEHSGDGPVIQYIVKYRQLGDTVVHTRRAGAESDLTLSGLRPRTSYELFVYCLRPGPDGMGERSRPLTFTTSCSENVVDNLTATTVNTYPLHVMVTWSPSVRVSCDTLYYEVAVTLAELDSCRRIPLDEQGRVTAGNTTDTQFRLKQLHLFSTYTLSVRAHTENGPGPYSDMTFETPESVPPRPENVTLQRTSHDFLRFSWEPILCGTRRTTIRRYQVELYDSDEILMHRGRILTKKMSSKIIGLEACSTYWFRVAAVGSERFGEYSHLVRGDTSAGVPPVVRNVGGRSVRTANRQTNLSVSWDEPMYICNITGYSVELFQANSDDCSNITVEPMVYSAHNVTHTTIDVPNLPPFTYYTIHIMAHTIYGMGETMETTIRTVQSVPTTAPSSDRRPDVTHDSATFDWLPLPCGSQGGQLVEYLYRLQSVNAKERREQVTGALPITTDECTFTNLESCKNYSFQIRARNNVGLGPYSEPRLISTSATVPSKVGEISVDYQPSDPTHILVIWDPPGYVPCPIVGYFVQISLVNQDTCTEGVADIGLAIHSTEEQHHHFRGLFPNSRYEIGIAAVTEAGQGELRKLLVQTNGTAPSSPPQRVTLQLRSPTSLTFSWEPPACGYRMGAITGYAYQLKSRDGRVLRNEEVRPPSVTLDRLQPFKAYLFVVQAYNTHGHGPYSRDAVARTMQTTPDQPSAAAVVDRTNSSIAISWRKPIHPNGIITKYTVSYVPTQRPEDLETVTQNVLHVRTDNNERSDDDSSEVPDDDTSSESEDVVGTNREVYVRRLDNLLPATEYSMTIVAHTSLGQGNEAVIVEFTKVTAPEQPLPPTLVPGVRGDTPVRIRFMEQANTGNIDVFQVTVKRINSVVRRSPVEGPGRFGSSPGYYIAAEWSPDNLPVELEIGDKKIYGDYYNAPLEEGMAYDIALCSVSRSPRDTATTCSTPVSVATKEDLKATPGRENSHRELSFVAVLCIIVIVASVVAMLVVRRRVRGNPPLTHTFAKELSQSVDSAIDVSVPPPEPMKRRRGGAIRVKPKVAPRKYSKQKLACSVSISDLPYHVRQLRANGDEKFRSNYAALPCDQLFPSEIAARMENRRKNRYLNTHPYDFSRVILQELPDIPFSDYINASFIDGFEKERQYIATQGPSNSTLGDFWRMIWQENIEVIVMLTNLRENEKKKCEQYWPAKNHFYGSISVFLINESYHTYFTERTLLLKKDGESETRQIQQCHFTSWPDMTLPETPTMLLEFRHRVRSLVTNAESPILVHCSAGVGRTGTFIAIDAMAEMAQQESAVNIWELIWNMRLKRSRMVQTLEQYMFIYECLMEELNCGYVNRSTISIDREVLSLRERHPVTNRTYLDEQLLVLDALAVAPSDNDLSAAMSMENSEKNRFDDILPLDKLRPYLMTASDGGRHNYINAIFVPGYRAQNMFLLTQTPMENTLPDFWRMIYDYRVSLIVSLDDMKDEDWSVSQFWPMADEFSVDPFVVRTTRASPLGDIYQREFSLRLEEDEDGRERTVKQLEIQDWSIEQSLPNHATLLSLIEMVDHVHRINDDKPIVVHCRTGIYRSGLFCAVYSAIAKLKSELKVDVFHVVKNLRKCSRRVVADEMEYLFCLEMLQAYIESSQIYANLTHRQ